MTLRASLLAASLVLCSCSDAFIERPSVDDTNVDDQLAVAGRVCTSPQVPGGFPVKVVLIVDQSGSMCISDPPGSQESTGFCEMYATVPPGVTQPARVRAINALLDQFQGQPNVEVALVPFETNVKGTWPMGMERFARPNAELRNRVNTLQAELGKGTDYQGALAYAYALIGQDITDTQKNNPVLLPRTRYVVVFLTDGVPYPRCSANDGLTQYADDLNPDLTWADSFGLDGVNGFCNKINPQDPDAITGYVQGTDRNQNYQLFSYVNQLVELKNQYNIGDIRLHTVLMFNEESVRSCGPICQDVYGRYARYPSDGTGPVAVPDGPAAAHDIAKWILKQLAQKGNGTYQEFTNFAGLAELNLGNLDYSSLASKYVMKTLMVQALRSEPGAQSRVVDSDGDGLIDDLDNDYTHDTNKFFPDSDEDGFDDTFEVRHADEGFRPDQKDGRGCDPASPITPNCDATDLTGDDGDGLSSWAEIYLKTRQTLIDSDADGIPDGLEVRYGLDPLARQPGIDTDGDGTSDQDEFRIGSSPIKSDKAFQERHAFQYSLVATEEDDRICYDFRVSNLQLVTPPSRGLTQGYNLFKIWFAEAPESGVATDYGAWRAACFWAQYAPPSVRVPAGPEIQPLTDDDFVAPAAIDTDAEYQADCAGISPMAAGVTP